MHGSCIVHICVYTCILCMCACISVHMSMCVHTFMHVRVLCIVHVRVRGHVCIVYMYGFHFPVFNFLKRDCHVVELNIFS